jgi:hypothetical protein
LRGSARDGRKFQTPKVQTPKNDQSLKKGSPPFDLLNLSVNPALQIKGFSGLLSLALGVLAFVISPISP